MIPSVVGYKDFEFDRFNQRLKWPSLHDLTCIEDAEPTKKLALKFFGRALVLYQHAQEEYARQTNDMSGRLTYQDDHINVLLEISKVYKIMSLLQPEIDVGDIFGNKPATGQSIATTPSQQVFPKLRWECLMHRLRTLDPVSCMKNLAVFHELSNICSQLFDLQYKSLMMLKRNKVRVQPSNI